MTDMRDEEFYHAPVHFSHKTSIGTVPGTIFEEQSVRCLYGRGQREQNGRGSSSGFIMTNKVLHNPADGIRILFLCFSLSLVLHVPCGGQKQGMPATRDMIQFHVSMDGNDNWTGLSGTPDRDRGNGPFLTIRRAQKAVREALRHASCTIVVSLHQGKYRLDQPLTFYKMDSGRDGMPVIWEAFEDDTVIFTSSTPVNRYISLTGDQGMDSREGIYSLNVSALGKRLKIGHQGPEFMLLQDDIPLRMTRYPDEGWLQVKNVDNSKKSETSGRSFVTLSYVGAGISPLPADPNAFAFGYWFHDWSGEYHSVAEWDSGEQLFEVRPPYHRYGYQAGQRFYFLNIRGKLDEAGELYADVENNILYFRPYHSPEISELSIIESKIPVVVFNGTENIRFRGIQFSGCYGPVVKITGGSNNVIERCTFRHIITHAVQIDGGNQNGVLGCEIIDIGASGVIVRGGDRQTLEAGQNYVKNSHISRFSQIQKTYQPAISIDGSGNIIMNNHIHDAPHQAIWLKGNDHIIQYNEIHNVGFETGDVGAIYTGRNWTYRGNNISYNFIHDISGPGKFGAKAIYLDDLASGFTVTGNVFYRCEFGVFIGGGRDNEVHNNVFIGCPIAIQIDNRGEERENLRDTRGVMYRRLREVDFTQPPYSSRYPELARILDEEPGLPKGNRITANINYFGQLLLRKPDRDEYWKKLIHVSNNLIDPEIGNYTELDELLRLLNAKMKATYRDFRPVTLENKGHISDR